MQITEVKTWLVQPPRGKTALFIKLETDAGVHGWGEAYTLTGRERALQQMVHDLGDYPRQRMTHRARPGAALMLATIAHVRHADGDNRRHLGAAVSFEQIEAELRLEARRDRLAQLLRADDRVA